MPNRVCVDWIATISQFSTGLTAASTPRAGGVVEQFVARPSAGYDLLLRGILDDPLR
jgi:hypothetical protein